MDLKKRSWAKSLTWRAVGIVILGAISFLFTRDWGATTGITVVFHSLRLVLYYYHERIWERVHWGRLKHPLSHLQLRDGLTAEDIEEIRQFLAEEGHLAEVPEYRI